MTTLSRTWTENLRILKLLKEVDLLDDLSDEEPDRGKVLARRCCPLHDGADNPLSLLIFKDGFACQTHGCHKERFGCNLFGLVCHLVYRATGKVMPFREAITYAGRHKAEIAALVPKGERYRGRSNESKPSVAYTSQDLASCLRVPDPFYLSRGYLPATLELFGVGTCVRQLPDGQYLPGWSVLPVMEHGYPNNRLVGYTARNPKWLKGGADPKWVHGIARSNHLFNFANAQHGTGSFVICEGPGDAMRWWEAGFRRAVAVMGSSVSIEQTILIHCATEFASKVYIAADADEAGRKFAESVQAKLWNNSKLQIIYPLAGYKDFGDMTPDQIRSVTT